MTVFPFRPKAILADLAESQGEHQPSPDCWCCPSEDEHGVYLHHERVPERWERAQAMGRGLGLLYRLSPSSRA